MIKALWIAQRNMFADVRDIGAMPLVLFQYYLSIASDPDGRRPSLSQTAVDLGLFDKQGKPSKSVVCHLKKTLIEKEWIEETDGEITIKKHLEFLNAVENISTTIENFSKCVEKNSMPLRNSQQNSFQPPHTPQEENIKIINTQAEDEEEEAPSSKSKKSKLVKTRISEDFGLTDSMRDWAKKNAPDLDIDIATENFIEHYSNRTDAKAEKLNWLLTWQKGMRLQLQWQKEDTKGKISPDKAKELINGNGSNQKSGNSTNTEKIRNRDYSKFDGFDPIKTFGGD